MSIHALSAKFLTKVQVSFGGSENVSPGGGDFCQFVSDHSSRQLA
jgi:hypothetical protein